jgi:hypothetical protein
MSRTLVINERTYSCGCTVANGCTCRGTPQRPIPRPLGLPVYNFEREPDEDDEQPADSTPTFVVNSGSHKPLGVPLWHW